MQAEAAFGHIELQRGYAEIEQKAVRRVPTQFVQGVGETVEGGGEQTAAIAPGRQPFGGSGPGLGVAVQTAQPGFASGALHQGRGVPGQPQRAVHVPPARTGSQGVEHFVEQHGMMLGRVGSDGRGGHVHGRCGLKRLLKS